MITNDELLKMATAASIAKTMPGEVTRARGEALDDTLNNLRQLRVLLVAMERTATKQYDELLVMYARQ